MSSKGSSLSPFLAGGIVAQKYRLMKQLGEGGMGVVWQAVNENTGGEVALKLIVRPERELRQRLLREARACCSIRHRSVMQIHDVGQTDAGDPFLVMELLTGGTLADLLARKRRLSQEEAATIGRDIARALATAHEKGIVHRTSSRPTSFCTKSLEPLGTSSRSLHHRLRRRANAEDSTFQNRRVATPMRSRDLSMTG